MSPQNIFHGSADPDRGASARGRVDRAGLRDTESGLHTAAALPPVSSGHRSTGPRQLLASALGLRVSLFLASAGAALSCALALILGALSGFAGGFVETLLLSCIGVVDSVPWLFLFLAVRALLPLNVSPTASIWITFAMLAILGGPCGASLPGRGPGVPQLGRMVFARACGIAGWRLWLRQALPTLRQVSLTNSPS